MSGRLTPAEAVLIAAAERWDEQRAMCHDPMTYRTAMRELEHRAYLVSDAVRALRAERAASLVRVARALTALTGGSE